MRKIWITCGWVLYGAGVFLVVTMGLAWLGEGKPSKIIPSIVMGCLFIFLGHNFIVPNLHHLSRVGGLPERSARSPADDYSGDLDRWRYPTGCCTRRGALDTLHFPMQRKIRPIFSMPHNDKTLLNASKPFRFQRSPRTDLNRRPADDK
jgi:hypothetical protein